MTYVDGDKFFNWVNRPARSSVWIMLPIVREAVEPPSVVDVGLWSLAMFAGLNLQVPPYPPPKVCQSIDSGLVKGVLRCWIGVFSGKVLIRVELTGWWWALFRGAGGPCFGAEGRGGG